MLDAGNLHALMRHPIADHMGENRDQLTEAASGPAPVWLCPKLSTAAIRRAVKRSAACGAN
jgi:hypothetical protein